MAMILRLLAVNEWRTAAFICAGQPVQRLCAFIAMTAVVLHPAAAEEFNYDESKVPEYQLPALLTAEDGTEVKTPEDWQNVRRPQILQMFEQHVYGSLPPAAPQLRTRVRSESRTAVGGKAVRRELTVYFSDDDRGPRMDLLIYTPLNATGPVPAFLGLNFGGNHTIESDTGIHITESWVRNQPAEGISQNQATAASRGVAASRWPLELIIARGYGLATAYYGDIDPDFDDGFRNGIHQLFPESSHRTAGSGGSISAWAWGLSRALDVLEDDPLTDGDRIAVIGHSRLGKTALWAGAVDTRFAMVISNNSGCGGAALSRRRFGETVARINTVFPHWFCLQHREYNDHEEKLPVDQHMLISLIAPRPVYVASASEDLWADPRGEFLSVWFAGPAYRLLGRSGLPSDAMPSPGQSLQFDVGYHIRSGPHDVTESDWQHYLDFADKHLQK